MADEGTRTDGGTNEGDQGGERTFSQAEVNDIVERRLKKERAKHADYDELKAAAEAHKDYDEILKDRDELKASAQRAELVGKVASACGVAPDLVAMLSGTTEEELTTQATALAKAQKGKAYPKVDDKGNDKPPLTADDIRKIKDPRERIRARAAHPELFQ